MIRIIVPDHKRFSAATNPAHAPSGRSTDQAKGRYITGHHGSRRDHRSFGDVSAAQNRRVGSDGGIVVNTRLSVGVPARKSGPRTLDVGKNRGRSHKDPSAQSHAIVKRHVVLNAATLADYHCRSDEPVLANHDPGSYPSPRHDVNLVPDFAASPEVCALFNQGGGVYKGNVPGHERPWGLALDGLVAFGFFLRCLVVVALVLGVGGLFVFGLFFLVTLFLAVFLLLRGFAFSGDLGGIVSP